MTAVWFVDTIEVAVWTWRRTDRASNRSFAPCGGCASAHHVTGSEGSHTREDCASCLLEELAPVHAAGKTLAEDFNFLLNPSLTSVYSCQYQPYSASRI